MVLKLTADKAETKTRFIARLAKCAGGKLKEDKSGNLVWDGKAPDPATPFSEALDKAIKSAKLVPFKLRAGPPPKGGEERWFDEFCDRTVYLDHVDALPEDPPAAAPEATTRCEAIIHFLVEYTDAAEAGETSCTAGYETAHRSGFDAQKRYRHGRGQGDPKDQIVDKDGTFIFIHADGSKTVVRKNEKGDLIVENVPAPDKNKDTDKKKDKDKKKDTDKKKDGAAPGAKPEEKKSAETPSAKTMLPNAFKESVYRFIGTVCSVGARPNSWSSLGVVYQRVTYRLSDNLGAPLQGDFVDVQHPLVRFASSADSLRPGLSRRHFAPGRKLVILADLAETEDGCLALRAASCDPVIAVFDRAERPAARGRPASTGSGGIGRKPRRR